MLTFFLVNIVGVLVVLCTAPLVFKYNDDDADYGAKVAIGCIGWPLYVAHLAGYLIVRAAVYTKRIPEL